MSKPNTQPPTVESSALVRPVHGGYPDYMPPKRRPWVLMSVGEVTQGDCDAIDRLVNSGADVVVVQDHQFERAVEVLKQARSAPWPNADVMARPDSGPNT